MTKRNGQKTAYAVETLARELRAGLYPTGQAMPSERQLCERFGVSRMTVRVILGRLKEDGLIYRRQGSGTFAYPPSLGPLRTVAFWLRDIDKVSSPYATEIMAGIDGSLSAVGAHLTVTTAPLHTWTEAFCRTLAGVVIIPYDVGVDDIHLLRNLGLPHVTVMESDLPGPAIRMNPRDAARTLTQGLLDRGHRRFALISGHAQHTDMQKRRGIADALATARLRIEDIPDYQTNYAPAAGGAAAAALLQQRPLPSAVMCFDDTLAMQFITAAQHAGFRVPDDVSVTGFNDSLFSACMTPRLSTVRFPLRQAGRKAACLLLDADGEGGSIQDVVLEHELMWRESVGFAGQTRSQGRTGKGVKRISNRNNGRAPVIS